MAIALEKITSSNLRGTKAGCELVEITLADTASSSTTKQTTSVPLGKTYRSVKPVSAVGQGEQFTIGVNITDLGTVAIATTAAAATANTKVFVTLECEV